VQHTSIKEAKRQLREIGFSLQKVDDEFILRAPGIEYFTDDLQDAIDTAKCEADRRNL
jgi:hypothetical protein